MTPPSPDSVVIKASPFVSVADEISKVPWSITSLEAEIEPVPDSASVSPEPIVVVPA